MYSSFALKTILVPVDFSERTEAEAEHAVNIAKHFGARLIFLHVLPIFPGPTPIDLEAAIAYSHDFSADIRAGIEGALVSLAQRVAPGMEVECIVDSGAPTEKIEEAAKAAGAELIVMPTAGRGRFRRHLLGSVTTKVLHDIPVPIFTGVHVQDVDPYAQHPYRRIACKLELDAGDEAILDWARDFAAAYEAELTVLTVLPFLDGPGAAPALPKHLREEALAAAQERLGQVAAAEGAIAHAAAIGGPVDKVLPEFLRARQMDLLVTGRTRSQEVIGVMGWRRDLIDTVRSTPCPTISV